MGESPPVKQEEEAKAVEKVLTATLMRKRPRSHWV